MSHTGRVVVAQTLLGFICIAVFLAIDQVSARSALLAQICVVVPSAYYAWVQARTFNAMRLVMHGVLKSLFTVSLITVCIVRFDIEPLGFFVTFAVMQLSYLIPSKKA